MQFCLKFGRKMSTGFWANLIFASLFLVQVGVVFFVCTFRTFYFCLINSHSVFLRCFKIDKMKFTQQFDIFPFFKISYLFTTLWSHYSDILNFRRLPIFQACVWRFFEVCASKFLACERKGWWGSLFTTMSKVWPFSILSRILVNNLFLCPK